MEAVRSLRNQGKFLSVRDEGRMRSEGRTLMKEGRRKDTDEGGKK